MLRSAVLISQLIHPLTHLLNLRVVVKKQPDSALVGAVKDVAAGTVAGVGITLVGHPFGQTHVAAISWLPLGCGSVAAYV